MSKKVWNHEQPPECIGEYLGKVTTLFLGQAQNIYVNIDRVQPGAMSAKYHAHSLQEEFFLILTGTGIQSQI